MRTIFAALIAVILMLAYPPGVTSQETPKDQPKETPATMEKSPAGEEKKMMPEETEAKARMVVSADEIKKWIGLPVYSSEGKEIGKVSKVLTENDDSLSEIRIETGGYFGFFTTTVIVKPDQFAKKENKIALKLTKEEAKKLPQPIS